MSRLGDGFGILDPGDEPRFDMRRLQMGDDTPDEVPDFGNNPDHPEDTIIDDGPADHGPGCDCVLCSAADAWAQATHDDDDGDID